MGGTPCRTYRDVMDVPLLRRLAPAVGLLLLSPICAEYLIGYDESIAHPLRMLGGLVLLAPLYGTVAVLVREIARRAGRGWPTILLLSAAFGLAQAGLIDQSLFHLDLGADVPDWASRQQPTTVPVLGIDARDALNFVGGHVIWSFAAPIAVVESCAPRLGDRPWLGKFGLTVMALLYLATAALFVSESTGASSAELVGTAVVVLALVVAAFAIPRRAGTSSRWVPPAWLLGCGAVALFAVEQQLPITWTWPAVLVDVLLLAGLGALLLVWSGRSSWRRMHVLAVAGAALVVRAGLAFLVEPLGDPSYVAKYAANTVILLGMLGLLVWVRRRLGDERLQRLRAAGGDRAVGPGDAVDGVVDPLGVERVRQPHEPLE